jgi:hypothetical protein
VEQVRPLIRQLAGVCEEHAYSWMLNNAPTVGDLESDLLGVCSVYTQSAALLAADWYNQQDRESSYFAAPNQDLPDEKVTNVVKWIFDGPQRPESRVRQVASRLVFDAARRTIYVNALTEGVGVARHELAGCCNDCVARATVRTKGRDGGMDDVDYFFHPACTGLLVAIRKEVYDPPPYADRWRTSIDAARRAGNVKPDDISRWLDGVQDAV